MEHAIRNLQSAWDLQDNTLCRIIAVQDLATRNFRRHSGAEALALRDLVSEAIILAHDLLASHPATFLRRWVATSNTAEVAREMGKDRSHLSRSYRPRVVMVVTDVFMRLTGARNSRSGISRTRERQRAGYDRALAKLDVVGSNPVPRS